MTPAEKRKKIVNAAKKLVGKPYKYGAYLETKDEKEPGGFDCSSFTQYVYKRAGIDIPRSSILQAVGGIGVGINGGGEFAEIKLKPADLLFLRGNKGHYDDNLFPGERVYIGHVMIYLGGGKIIHAKSPQGVIVQLLSEIKEPIIRIKRIVNE
ncbi:MAG: C40 family peptidase [Parcubacteria group bacterium]|nr:C40 family peptidase [Parcubacteria group bacterium]